MDQACLEAEWRGVDPGDLLSAIETLGVGMAFYDRGGGLACCNAPYMDICSAAGGRLQQGATLAQSLGRLSVRRGGGASGDGSWSTPHDILLGDDRWVRLRAAALDDGRTIVLLSDITAIKRRDQRLTESEERYALAMAGTNEGMWDWDVANDVICIAPRVAEVLGIPVEDILTPRDWLSVIHPEDRDDYHRAMVGHLKGQSAFFACEYRLARMSDDGPRWVRHRGLGMRDERGRVYRMAGSVGDVSERRRAEDAMRHAKEQAEIANRGKTEFLANIGHELRTPLNAIIGFSEVIQAELFGPLPAVQYKEYARNITDSGMHLLEVINDILDVSRIEAGKMVLHPESVVLHEVAGAATRLIQQRAAAAGLRLVVDVAETLPPVWGEPRRLKQILLNLLSNAVKFTPPGGSISVAAADAGSQDEAREVVLSVADTGIGMARQDLDAAFAPFGQVDSRLQRRYEGTGLGLPLTKAFVELHGGRLEVDSDLGKGTTITIRLPAVPGVRAHAGR